MLTTGVDIVEISRIGDMVERWGQRFLDRVYTPGEQAFSRGRIPQLAARFAAKEAVMKALGTGIRGVGWREVEVIRRRGRPPEVALHGRAISRATGMGVSQVAISLSHSRDYAIASVVMSIDENSHH
ncbi:MAG: holo-acyl-carrier-protein synthase [Dehalococcoidia bacterium]|nr:holo-acyl-carrier-protein synthase [Dehalococcoidia bacterium]